MFVRSPSVRHLGPLVSISTTVRGGHGCVYVCCCVCLDWSAPDPVQCFGDEGRVNTHTYTHTYTVIHSHVYENTNAYPLTDSKIYLNIQMLTYTNAGALVHNYARMHTQTHSCPFSGGLDVSAQLNCVAAKGNSFIISSAGVQGHGANEHETKRYNEGFTSQNVLRFCGLVPQ